MFVVAPEPSEAFLKNFYPTTGVYRSAGFAQTGHFLIREILFGVYRSAGFAQTGLFQISKDLFGVYRYVGFEKTGLSSIGE